MKTISEECDIHDTANGFGVAVRDTLGSLLGSIVHSDPFSAEQSLWHPTTRYYSCCIRNHWLLPSSIFLLTLRTCSSCSSFLSPSFPVLPPAPAPAIKILESVLVQRGKSRSDGISSHGRLSTICCLTELVFRPKKNALKREGMIQKRYVPLSHHTSQFHPPPFYHTALHTPPPTFPVPLYQRMARLRLQGESNASHT